MDETLNLDILEILLSETYQLSNVLNGYLTLMLRKITETHYGGEYYYQMDTIFQHGSLQALEPELLKQFYSKLYIPDNQWKDLITDALRDFEKHIPKTLRTGPLRGVNWEVVKYSHIDFNLLEHNNTLYNKLYTQTNSFDPVELGKRVVLVPGEIPKDFDDLIKAYEPLTKEFKIIKAYLEQTYDLRGQINDTETMNEVIKLYIPGDVEETKRDLVKTEEDFVNEAIAYHKNAEAVHKKNAAFFKETVFIEYEDLHNESAAFHKEAAAALEIKKNKPELTMAMLEKYREHYEACITVKPDYTRLYTRARFISNFFIDKHLNESLIKYIVETSPIGPEDTISRAHEFLGMNASNILTFFHKAYLDKEGFPTFSDLYLFGSIETRLFPDSINYTYLQKLCFCEWCNPFLYSAQLYESNTGEVYLIVNLKVQPEDFLKYLLTKKCHYDLFLYDMKYHYGRLEALHSFRDMLETFRHKRFNFNLDYVHKNYGKYYHNWFSSSSRLLRCLLNAEDIIQRTRRGYE